MEITELQWAAVDAMQRERRIEITREIFRQYRRLLPRLRYARITRYPTDVSLPVVRSQLWRGRDDLLGRLWYVCSVDAWLSQLPITEQYISRWYLANGLSLRRTSRALEKAGLNISKTLVHARCWGRVETSVSRTRPAADWWALFSLARLQYENENNPAESGTKPP